MNQTINQVLTRPDVRKLLEGNGSKITATTPEGFGQTLANFVDRVQKLARDAKLDLKHKG